MSADEMLKKVGLNLCSIEQLDYSKKALRHNENGFLHIIFNEDNTIDITHACSLPIQITFEELQAINKKVEELGWIKKISKEE